MSELQFKGQGYEFLGVEDADGISIRLRSHCAGCGKKFDFSMPLFGSPNRRCSEHIKRGVKVVELYPKAAV
jgi:hypothetical protein